MARSAHGGLPRTIRASVAKVREASLPTGKVAPSTSSPAPEVKDELATGSLSERDGVFMACGYMQYMDTHAVRRRGEVHW